MSERIQFIVLVATGSIGLSLALLIAVLLLRTGKSAGHQTRGDAPTEE